MNDLKGKKFGRLFVIEKTDERAGNSIVWRCKCDCGKDCTASSYALTHGLKRSCGCLQTESRKIDIRGRKFGFLTAIEPTNRIVNNSVVWRFECSRCGKTCEYPAESVLHGGRQSCGCLQNDVKARQAIEMQKNCGREDGTIMCRIVSNKPQINNTSGYRGVYWHKKWQKWCAVLRFQGVLYHGGYYDDIMDAALARQTLEETYLVPYIESKKNSGTPE